MGCSSSRNRMETGVRVADNVRPTRSPEAVPEVARTKSNGPGTLPNRNPGPVFWLWTVVCDWPSRQIASGSIATKNVHHSGASAAEFHRLPDAPKVMLTIPLPFFYASFIDFVA